MRLRLHILLLPWLGLILTSHVVSGAAKSEVRTKQLLQNIRGHLAQQVDEVVHERECEGGLTLCEPTKSKEEEDEEEDSEEIPPPPKMRGGHKPLIKVNPHDVILTMIHKSSKPLIRKLEKDVEPEKDIKVKKGKKGEDSDEDDDDDDDDDDDKPKRKKARSVKAKKASKEGEEGVEFPEELPVFAATSSIVKTTLCRKHSRVYLRQLKRYKLWALMMYDASAKLPSGILQGNINQYGDFDECLAINAMFKDPKGKKQTGKDRETGIQGKYCLANIDVTAADPDVGLRQAVYRSQAFAFVRSRADDPGHFIPRFSSINWGLCVPSACLANDVERSLELALSEYNETSGVLFNVNVDKDNCVVKEDTEFYFSFMTLVTVLFYGTVIGTAGYATYKDLEGEFFGGQTEEDEEKVEKEGEEEEGEGKAEEEEIPVKEVEEEKKAVKEEKKAVKKEEKKVVKEEEEEEEEEKKEEKEEEGEGEEKPQEEGESEETAKQGKLNRIMMAFSLKRNFEELVKDSDGEGDILCIHGIKSIFTIMLYFAHKTIPLALTPFNNRIMLTQMSNEASSVLLRASIIYTDSFLLISGVLTSYNLCKEVHESGRIAWLRRSLARFIRLTPALLAVVLFYAYIADHLGSGPLWTDTVRKNAELCQDGMWKNLLYLQNFFAFEKMCAPQTHQLALDMQLTLISPLLVYVLYRFDRIGLGSVTALFLFSSILRYTATSSNNLSLIIYHGMTVSQLYRTANLLYSQALHRASPYVFGVVLGFYLKKLGGQFEFPKPFIAFGWIAATCFGFLSIVTPSHLADRSYVYDVDEAAQYAALSPISWSLALGWVIVACHLGHGGRVNEVLCNKALVIFSRISYSVYLTQFLVFFHRVGIKRIPETFSVSGSFNVTEFLIIIVLSTIVTLLFDLPMKEIKSIILERSSEANEDASGEEGAEGTETTEEGDLEVIEEEGVVPEEEEELLDLRPEDEEELEEIEDEEFEEQPLRRSSRVKFDEDTEDMEFWENENRDLEKQKQKKQAQSFWGKDED